MNQKGFNPITAVIVLVVITGLIGGFWLFSRQKSKIGYPDAGVINIETAKAGEQYGVWTVKENNIKLSQYKNPIDGSVYASLGGQVSFEGSLELSGRYAIGESGVGFFVDTKYHMAFPKIVDAYQAGTSFTLDGKLFILLLDADTNFFGEQGVEGAATIIINNLAYQSVSCLACDAYQGFLASIAQIISVDTDSVLQVEELRTFDISEEFLRKISDWQLYSDALPLGFAFKYPKNYGTFPITPLEFFDEFGQASVAFGNKEKEGVFVTLDIKDLEGVSYDTYKSLVLDSCKSRKAQEECFSFVEYKTFKGYVGLAYSYRDPEIESLGHQSVIVFVHNGNSFLFSRFFKYGAPASEQYILFDIVQTIDFFEP